MYYNFNKPVFEWVGDSFYGYCPSNLIVSGQCFRYYNLNKLRSAYCRTFTGTADYYPNKYTFDTAGVDSTEFWGDNVDTVSYRLNEGDTVETECYISTPDTGSYNGKIERSFYIKPHNVWNTYFNGQFKLELENGHIPIMLGIQRERRNPDHSIDVNVFAQGCWQHLSTQINILSEDIYKFAIGINTTIFFLTGKVYIEVVRIDLETLEETVIIPYDWNLTMLPHPEWEGMKAKETLLQGDADEEIVWIIGDKHSASEYGGSVNYTSGIVNAIVDADVSVTMEDPYGNSTYIGMQDDFSSTYADWWNCFNFFSFDESNDGSEVVLNIDGVDQIRVPIIVKPKTSVGTLEHDVITGYVGDTAHNEAIGWDSCSGNHYFRWSYVNSANERITLSNTADVDFTITEDMDWIGCSMWDKFYPVNMPMPMEHLACEIIVQNCHRLNDQTQVINGYPNNVKPVFVSVEDCDSTMTYSWHIVGETNVISTSPSFDLTLDGSMIGKSLRCDMNNSIVMVDIPITVDGCYVLVDQTDSITGNTNQEVGAFVDIDVCSGAVDVSYSWSIMYPFGTLIDLPDTTSLIDITLTNDMNGAVLVCKTIPDVGVQNIPITVNVCPKLNDQTDSISGNWGDPASAFVDITLCDDNNVHTFATNTFYNWYIEDDPTTILSQSDICDFTLNSWHNGRKLIAQTAINVNTQPMPITVRNIPATPDYWWIKKVDGTYFEVNCRTYKQDIIINYELQEVSSRRYRSIDRGARSDRYATTLSFSGDVDYIKNLIIVLDDLRLNNYPVVMGGFPKNVNIFGDHIDYSSEIFMFVDKLGELKSTKFNTLEIDITMLASTPVIIGNPILPEGLKCLTHRYTTSTDRNTHINETYFRHNYFVDRNKDKYTFKGEYILTIDDNKNLFNWWQRVRGDFVTINEEQFGVTEMFGPKFTGSNSFDVVIKDISYSLYSPTLRKVTIELEKM